jgi:hypothetical protein
MDHSDELKEKPFTDEECRFIAEEMFANWFYGSTSSRNGWFMTKTPQEVLDIFAKHLT